MDSQKIEKRFCGICCWCARYMGAYIEKNKRGKQPVFWGKWRTPMESGVWNGLGIQKVKKGRVSFFSLLLLFSFLHSHSLSWRNRWQICKSSLWDCYMSTIILLHVRVPINCHPCGQVCSLCLCLCVCVWVCCVLTLLSFWSFSAFTKCKSNLRDGFRLENMSWRLWYREAMIRKRLDTEATIALQSSPHSTSTSSSTAISTDLYTTTNNNNDTITNVNKHQTTRLVRTRSLPSLSWQTQNLMDACQATTSSPTRKSSFFLDNEAVVTTQRRSSKSSKFYIDQDDDEESDPSDLHSLDYDQEGDCYFDDDDTEYSDDSSDISSLDNSMMIMTNTTTTNTTPNSHIGSSNNTKPVSLLTTLLQKESSSNPSRSSPTQSFGGLRRSHCYGRLDQWFSAALSSW